MKIFLNLLAGKKIVGFTLLELLLASFMTFFVVSATGYAILVMTRESIAGDVSSDLQFNTNRASDFITSEVQQAKSISINSSPTIPSDCSVSGEVVLGLNIDYDTVTNAQVIYYTKAPDAPWIGASSIYRCGPSLTASGDFATPATPGGDPPYTDSILIDSISTSASATTNNCSSGTTQFPVSPTAGFYICYPTGSDTTLDTPTEKIIEIHVNAATDALADRGMTTSGGDGRFDDNATYEVVTKVFARSATPSPTP